MRVFVSSTYKDLLNYRTAVTRAILTAGNLTEDMLYWPAEEAPPLDISRRRLRSSQLVVLLIAHRYGTPPAGHNCSITELEFDEASQHRIPVLAFCVDPEYPWPPSHVETDAEVRGRLERFIRKVKKSVAVTSFTSPESLEVAVTNALAHFQGPAGPVTSSHYADARLRQVSRPESLFYSPDSTVSIGVAPDGAGLLLSVSRQIGLAEDLALVARKLGKSLNDEVFREIYSQLNQEARALATASGIYGTAVRGRAVDCFVSGEPLIRLASPSLFQSMLGSMGEAYSERGGLPSGRESTIVSGAVRAASAADTTSGRITSLGGGNRFLCVVLDADEGIWSGGWADGESGSARLRLWRPFIEEGLERLSGVQYIIRESDGKNTVNHVRTERQQEYAEKWVDLLTSANDEKLQRMSTLISIPRSSILRFVLTLVEEVAALHEEGRLHGDIKPSNVLINRQGSLLIDEVGLRVGDVSPTVTPGWSPSEQLLRQPLTCAADIFPLGQILLHVLGAEPLGREVQYRLPGGSMATVVDNPSVYISGDSHIAPRKRQREWCALIERALKTDPRKRWQSAAQMADEMRVLFVGEDLAGRVGIRLPWGGRPSLISGRAGELSIGWVMRSTASSGWRERILRYT